LTPVDRFLLPKAKTTLLIPETCIWCVRIANIATANSPQILLFLPRIYSDFSPIFGRKKLQP